jgi:hypothetical protein
MRAPPQAPLQPLQGATLSLPPQQPQQQQEQPSPLVLDLRWRYHRIGAILR